MDKEPKKPRRFIIPLIVACALFMENLDSTVIATALPTIADALGENPLHLSLAITSYLLSLAIFIPISGYAADRFGARTIFRAAIIVFTLGSIACGLALSLPMLVAARMLQGMGGAMMVPVGRLVLLRSIPKSELVDAMSYLTVPALLGPVMGPPVGGFIVTHWSWRWIFFINIPIGLLGIVLATIFIDPVREEEVPPFDAWGFITIAIGLAGLMFGFETAGRGVLPGTTVAALAGCGAVALALYAVHALKTPRPLLDPGLFRIVSFRVSILGGLVFRTGIGALPFLLPLMLQLGFGLSAFSSGLLTFSSAVGAMAMKMTAAPIIRFFGFRRILIGNGIISGLFVLGYGLFRPQTPEVLIFAALLAGGFFRSLEFTSINTLAYADVPAPLMSRATTLASMAQQLALSFGVGMGALLLHLTLLAKGQDALLADDFIWAFLCAGAVSLASIGLFGSLPKDAGAELSGRR